MKKNMMKKKNTKQFYTRLAVLAVTAVLAVVAVVQPFAKPANADTYDDQIKVLQSQIDSYNSKASDLAAQADTLNNKIAELQNQQSQLQAQINLTTAKSNELKAQIAANEAKIKEQSTALAQTLSNLYYSQQTSTLDILMNSNSVSDYVDKTTQQDSLQQQISASVDQITAIKKQLESQKAQVDQLLATQQAQQDQLTATQQQQQDLLAQTQGQEANYQALVTQSNAQIASLKAQQAAANAAKQKQYNGKITAGDPNHGGYPAYLDNAPQDSLIDPWGMYNRECVSYAAWKVQQTYGNMPYWGGSSGGGGVVPSGSAKYWVGKAQINGIPYGTTPKVGSVAVMTSGTYGHVAWVQQVNGSQIYVSQYNWGMTGQYSEMWIDSAAFQYYLYFGEWK